MIRHKVIRVHRDAPDVLTWIKCNRPDLLTDYQSFLNQKEWLKTFDVVDKIASAMIEQYPQIDLTIDMIERIETALLIYFDCIDDRRHR